MSERAELIRENARRIREVLNHVHPTAAERRFAIEHLARLEADALAAEGDVGQLRGALVEASAWLPSANDSDNLGERDRDRLADVIERVDAELRRVAP